MSKVFTTQEQEELNKASNALNLDADSKKLAFAYFLEYKQKTKQPVVEKLSLIVGCSILSAAKSQVLTTVRGDTIRGVGISITQLLRGLDLSNRPANIEEFLMALKEFMAVVTLAADITTELKGIIDKFAFSYTFFVKFNSLFKQLELDQSMSDKEEYLACLKNLGWLLYTNARTSILQNRTELIESVFMLAATLTHLLQNLPANIAIPYFEKDGKNIVSAETNKRNGQAIQEGIFELLKLNKSSAEEVVSHQKSLQEMIKKLLDNNVLKSSQENSFEGLYEPTVLFSNFEKLDAHYQKKLGFDDLDERFFIRDRKAFQAGMFTPFAKQGSANKLSININITKSGDPSQSIQKVFPSQRVLNYEMSEPVTMKSNLNEIRFAGKAVPASPFSSKIPPATPVTRALEMYNWLSDKVRIKKNISGLTVTLENYLNILDGKFKDETISRANNIVEKVLNFEKENSISKTTPPTDKKASDKHNQIVSLYFKVLEELLSQEEKKTKTPDYSGVLSNENFHKALIACSIETVFFVNNSSNISFTKLLEICDIQPFEFWRIIGSFAKFDPQIPFPIKKHLHSLELKILMCLAWKKDSAIHKVVKKFLAESTETETGSPTSAATEQSPSIQVSKQISQLNLTIQRSTSSNGVVPPEGSSNSESPSRQAKTELTHSQELFFQRVLHHTALHVYQLCDLLGINEQISEQIWSVMKYALSSETTLLVDRHIDQIILSTIYGACKVLHIPLKFQEIITKYQELPSFDKSDFIENIHQVYINETEKADLIKFYNLVYIPQMKTYLFSLNAPTSQAPKSATPQVKKPLVPALFMDSPLRKSLPNPALAYNKSISAHSKTTAPPPKYGMTPRTGALYAFGESPSRTLETINNLASKRQINFDDSQDTSNSDSIIKKIKPSSILDKIIEQRGEDADNEPVRLPVTAASKTNLLEMFQQNSTINKFSSFSEPGQAGTKIQINTQGVGFSFPQLKPVQLQKTVSAEAKMTVETPDQGQSGSSSPGATKSEQGGFKKVQKKDSPTIPELK